MPRAEAGNFGSSFEKLGTFFVSIGSSTSSATALMMAGVPMTARS